jgi:ubiquinol-cytochrome c reductase iron-sulfur subunit
MSDQQVDQGKRTWLIATGCAGAVGGVATAVPFVSTFAPSERAKAAGAPVEVDISAIKPGEKLTVEWRGKPVWIVRRTPEQLEALKKNDSQLADPNSDRKAFPIPDYAKNENRSLKPEYLVVVGICSHLGCSPSDKFTPGAQPAPDNLEVPPYMYLSDTRLVIGEDKKA